jgi:hypothetical protein
MTQLPVRPALRAYSWPAGEVRFAGFVGLRAQARPHAAGFLAGQDRKRAARDAAADGTPPLPGWASQGRQHDRQYGEV